MRLLEGTKVIALEHAVAAPLCTRHLADLGARVIKIERPGTGDFARQYDTRVRGLASYFAWTSRSKESLALDLRHPEAGDILGRLLEDADILVQNLAPGAAARLGLAYDTLKTSHPRLIVCDISGYGPNGPYADKKAYDLLIQAEAGFLSITGTADEPARAGCSIADIAAGIYAYCGILAALIQRGRTGRGDHVEISMLESLVEWMSQSLYYAFDGASAAPRTGASHATIYPYGPFPTAGNGTVLFGLQNEREWAAFCEKVLQQRTLATDARFCSNTGRVAARTELHAIIVEAFSRLTAPQVARRLDDAQIAHARVNTPREVWDHAQLRARGRWVEIDTPVGRIPAALPPGLPQMCHARMGAVPGLGEHTRAILAEIGFDAPAIARLQAEHAI